MSERDGAGDVSALPARGDRGQLAGLEGDGLLVGIGRGRGDLNAQCVGDDLLDLGDDVFADLEEVSEIHSRHRCRLNIEHIKHINKRDKLTTRDNRRHDMALRDLSTLACVRALEEHQGVGAWAQYRLVVVAHRLSPCPWFLYGAPILVLHAPHVLFLALRLQDELAQVILKALFGGRRLQV